MGTVTPFPARTVRRLPDGGVEVCTPTAPDRILVEPARLIAAVPHAMLVRWDLTGQAAWIDLPPPSPAAHGARAS